MAKISITLKTLSKLFDQKFQENDIKWNEKLDQKFQENDIKLDKKFKENNILWNKKLNKRFHQNEKALQKTISLIISYMDTKIDNLRDEIKRDITKFKSDIIDVVEKYPVEQKTNADFRLITTNNISNHHQRLTKLETSVFGKPAEN